MGDSDALSGCTVLVSRPAKQSAPLLKMIRQQGGTPLSLPMIDVEAVPDTEKVMHIDNLADYDYVIFASVNAVDFFLPLLIPGKGIGEETALVAIGRATAQCLAQKLRPATIVPSENQTFNTENLLQHPELVEIQGKQILLVKGEGGRQLLAETLRARGAEVTEAIVYRRIRLEYEHQVLQETIDVVDLLTATSIEILQNLCVQFADWSVRLYQLPLIVISERIAHQARSRGFRHVLVTQQADDQAIVKSLQKAAGRINSTPQNDN